MLTGLTAALAAVLAPAAQSGCDPAWLPFHEKLSGAVFALVEFDGELVAGGAFLLAGGEQVRSVARWDGSGWAPLVTGANGGVRALLPFEGDLYVGGDFTGVSGVAAAGVARWDGTGWFPVGDGLFGVTDKVWTLELFDDGGGVELYAGGSFVLAGGGSALRVARLEGDAFQPVGGGMDDTVLALEVFDDGSGPALYAGGSFLAAGGVPARHVARWDGTSWSEVGGGANGDVYALAVHDDGSGRALYAGGWFDQIGGVPAQRVARWDGTSWAPVGGGFDLGVLGLTAVDDGSGPALYAVGGFDEADGAPASGIARWDGSTWSAVGAAFPGVGAARAVGTYEGELYAGGTSIEDDNYIVRWGCPVAPVPGCGAHSSTLSAVSGAARVGQPFDLALAGALPSGLALLFLGAEGTDEQGCGTPSPWGELLLALAPAPASVHQAAVTAGAAAFALAVPDEPALVGLAPWLQAAGVALPGDGSVELSNALIATILP